MQLRLIRSATLRLTYAGREILTDPFLANKGSIESFAGISKNPIVDLPCPAEEVFSGVEMVIISHLHVDHFDPLAQDLLAKDTLIFCQPGDETQILAHGFEKVNMIDDHLEWSNISLTRTPGQHGTGAIGKRMGRVSGFVLQAGNEPTIYWAGDTIWNTDVEKVIEEFRPEIIITHSSGARFGDSAPIVMDAEQTIAVCQKAPRAIVVAVHMESLDHGTVSRADLRSLAENMGIGPEQLLIPADGEAIL